MKNTQPKGTQRWAISNIIGDKKLFKLEAAGFKVVSRDDLRKKQDILETINDIVFMIGLLSVPSKNAKAVLNIGRKHHKILELLYHQILKDEEELSQKQFDASRSSLGDFPC